MSLENPTIDKAGKAYWDSVWNGLPVPKPIDPRDRSLDNSANLRFHTLFQEVLGGARRGASLLEIGCARSAWLPYFAREFGFEITGLDYSELGCEQEETILERTGAAGRIVCADMFDPPDDMKGSFDAIVSFGVVEHFQDTVGCIRAIADLLAPSGIAVTIIPNLCGAVGSIVRSMNARVYSLHVPIDPAQLAAAHIACGLDVIQARYFMSTHFGVLNLNGIDPESKEFVRKRRRVRAYYRLSKIVWALERLSFNLPATRFLSPYAICVACKAPAS